MSNSEQGPYGAPGHGRGDDAGEGSGPGVPPPPPPPSGASPGYGTPPAYGTPPGYGAPPAYGAPLGYEAPPAYGAAPPAYGAPPPAYGAAAGVPHGAPVGYPAQPGYGGYGTGLPPGWTYASWGSRVAAALLDGLFSMLCLLPAGILAVVLAALASSAVQAGEDPPAWVFVIVAPVFVACYVFALRNTVWFTGTRGQSWGKKMIGIHVLSADRLVPIGGGMGLVRWIVVPLVSQLTCGLLGILDVLWPLWDVRHQALHDKLVSSIVVRPPV